MLATRAVRAFAPIIAIGAVALGCTAGNRELSHERALRRETPPSALDLERPLAMIPGRTSDVLTSAEMSTAHNVAVATLDDVLKQLRPTFLRPATARAAVIPSRTVQPSVFINGVFQGPIHVLREIPARAVAEVQYMRALDAMLRYGQDYSAGIILVWLKR